MNLMPGVTRLTADGVVGTSGQKIRVFQIHLVSGGTLSTTTFKNGTTTGGTAYIQVDGTASKGVTWESKNGILFPNGCFMDTDANITFCAISYTEEM
jgi:hypothetical protein